MPRVISSFFIILFLSLILGTNVFADEASDAIKASAQAEKASAQAQEASQRAEEASIQANVASEKANIASAKAQAALERKMITTTVPAAKEIVVTPSGFVNCFTIEAGWRNDIWVAKHRICQYSNAPEGVAWIEGYWACTKYRPLVGECTSWDWIAGHWVKTLDVY